MERTSSLRGRGPRSGHRWSTPARRQSSSGPRGAGQRHGSLSGLIGPRPEAPGIRLGAIEAVEVGGLQSHGVRNTSNSLVSRRTVWELRMGSGPVSCDAKHCTALAYAGHGISELDPARRLPRKLARLRPMPGPDQVRQEARTSFGTRPVCGLTHLVVIGMTIVRPRCEDKVTGLEKRDQQSIDVVSTDASIGESQCVGERRRRAEPRHGPRRFPRDEAPAAPRLVQDCLPRHP